MIEIKLPNLQVNFANRLVELRSTQLQDALAAAVGTMDLKTVDKELHALVCPESLSLMAKHGMRGELLFMVPCILQKNPKLLCYYRTLLGYSQKEFFGPAASTKSYKSLEFKGKISKKQLDSLPELCTAMNNNASYMLEKLDDQMISPGFFDQLSLLTVGANLRGSENVRAGEKATAEVFSIIQTIVASKMISSDAHQITVKNNSARLVVIQFAPDPDIVIQEQLSDTVVKKSLAIEVKGGRDIANIHNRIGEAEKSHQKAKADGYVDCWTIVNVNRLDLKMAKKESPTTNYFYSLSKIKKTESDEYKSFAMQIKSAVGI